MLLIKLVEFAVVDLAHALAEDSGYVRCLVVRPLGMQAHAFDIDIDVAAALQLLKGYACFQLKWDGDV